MRWLLLACLSFAGIQTSSSTWSRPQCSLVPTTTRNTTTSTNEGAPTIFRAWFTDVGTKVFQHSTPPAQTCGPALQISGARGEHVTFQIAVRASGGIAVLKGVEVSVSLSSALSATVGEASMITRRHLATLIRSSKYHLNTQHPLYCPPSLAFTVLIQLETTNNVALFNCNAALTSKGYCLSSSVYECYDCCKQLH